MLNNFFQQKIFCVVFAVILILLCLGIYFAFFHWKTFTNKEFNYKISYPPSLKLGEISQFTKKTISFKIKGKEGWAGLNIFAGQYRDINESVADLQKKYGNYFDVIVSDITVDGMAGKKVKIYDNEDFINVITWYMFGTFDITFPTESTKFIQLVAPGLTPGITSPTDGTRYLIKEKTSDKIVSTFRFLEKD